MSVSQLSPARKLAHKAIVQVRSKKAYLGEFLPYRDEFKQLSDEDKAFCYLLSSGVIATQGSLDILIDRVFIVKTKMSAAIRDVLRLCAYELYFLKKDSHVAVSQAVELAKQVSARAKGLVNWVGRRMAEAVPDFPFGDPATSDEAFCMLHGFPVELYQLFVDSLGRSRAAALVRAQDSVAPLFVTALPSCIKDEEVEPLLAEHGITASPLLPLAGAWLVHDPAKFIRAGLLEREGLIAMDYSAQIVAAIAAGTGGGSILEAGSGRGTKTAVMTSRALRNGKRTKITALDIHAYKHKVAKRRLNTFGIRDVEHVNADASQEDELERLGSYATVFLDAPCSGTGTLRRNPEIVWSLSLDKIKELSQLQARMLKSLAKHVKPGGEFIYSTCSVLPHENERVIENFLQSTQGKDFELAAVYERKGLSAAEAKNLRDHCTPLGNLRTFPVEGGADGHFCARLIRKKL